MKYLIIIVCLLSCSLEHKKEALKTDEIRPVFKEKVSENDSIIAEPIKSSGKEVVFFNPSYQEFIPKQTLKSGNYYLLKMVYITDKHDFFIEFGDSLSFKNPNDSKRITYQVFPEYLHIEANALTFYGHSGALGEVEATMRLKNDALNNYVSMQGDVSFLSNRFTNVKFERRTSSF